MRVVIIGGFGNFGARICRRLVQETGFEIVATSRRRNTALESVKSAALDMDSPTFAAQLEVLNPELVIHCAGPFQRQGASLSREPVRCRRSHQQSSILSTCRWHT